MIYPFKCSKCGTYDEVVRPHELCSEPAFCPACSSLMDRVYTIPQFNCKVSKYSKVFGIDMANSGKVSDMRKAYYDKTGSEMVEIGNEKVKCAPVRHDYTIDRGAFN